MPAERIRYGTRRDQSRQQADHETHQRQGDHGAGDVRTP
jgi:hypothetical protein